jgi:hypothetical protein
MNVNVALGVLLLTLILCVAQVDALALELPAVRSLSTPVAEVHRLYADLPDGKYVEDRVSIDAVVLEVKQTSPRLTFLRVRDVASTADDGDDDSEIIELLLRERDSFLSPSDIERIVTAAAQPGATLHCQAFPERLGLFDGPSFFPHLPPPAEPVCLHVVAANVSLATGECLELCPIERPQSLLTTKTTSTTLPGSMPPLSGRKNRSRGGNGNRDRGGIFAAWALETFGSALMRQGILDIAGGSGQLAFQLGVRRGLNTTVVDPRELRLASDQQRTLQYHRQTGLRLVPKGRDSSLPQSDYGHHFQELIAAGDIDSSAGIINTSTNPQKQKGDRTWLVGGEAHVRHLQTYFDTDFVSSSVWCGCSVVLGMHPDEATEDIVDLALAHDKPFAVVPCCVFWRRDPHRRTSSGRQVRTWEQFCEYLVGKDERIQVATLPFPGRNTVLFSLGPS